MEEEVLSAENLMDQKSRLSFPIARILYQNYCTGACNKLINYNGKIPVPFTGAILPIEDFIRIHDDNSIKNVFIGLAAIGPKPSHNFTIVMIGLKDNNIAEPDHAYNYGQKVPPGFIIEADIPQDTEHGEEKNKHSNKIIADLFTSNVVSIYRSKEDDHFSFDIAKPMLCYYKDRHDVLYHGTQKFYGVILTREDNKALATNPDLTHVYISLGALTDTAESEYTLIAWGLRNGYVIDNNSIFNYGQKVPPANVTGIHNC